LRERDDDIRIVVIWVQTVSAKIDYLMSRRSELGNHFFLQTKSAVIGSDSYSHICFMGLFCLPPRTSIKANRD
jgi:hypothetical protein